MDILIEFRHLEETPGVKSYAFEKAAHREELLPQGRSTARR
ncbi:hypothetical protein OV090_35305 [Nannocystis sp. RBIL2]|nr:hypothetical protein [Nannocystis sp. RBIL2]MCY1070065.1 hypothetical protein [Nannocystis sp. RBIL2]